jgi:starch phosphorylase
MATILPRFNTQRMLNDYLSDFYLPASRQGRHLFNDNYAKARELAHWKANVRAKWVGVEARPLATPQMQLTSGDSIQIQVAVRLNDLQPTDVAVELLLSRKVYHPEVLVPTQADLQNIWQNNKMETVSYRFVPEHPLHDSGEYLYNLTFKPELCGGLSYRIRVFPYHEVLVDAHEMGMMKWV